jgi:hypothetical protein
MFSVELTGPGLSLKRELPEARAHELLLWLLSGPKDPIAPARSQSTGEPKPGHSAPAHKSMTGDSNDHLLAVREFMEQHKPVRIPDKIACLALYLRDHRGAKEFGRAELVRLFQEAAETLPKNLGRDIRWTQQCGWIAPAPGNNDAFYLTKRGEEAVNQCFPKELVAKTKITTAPRRRRSTAEVAKSE